MVLGRCRTAGSPRRPAHTSSTRTSCIKVGWPVWQHYSGYAQQRIIAGIGKWTAALRGFAAASVRSCRARHMSHASIEQPWGRGHEIKICCRFKQKTEYIKCMHFVYLYTLLFTHFIYSVFYGRLCYTVDGLCLYTLFFMRYSARPQYKIFFNSAAVSRDCQLSAKCLCHAKIAPVEQCGAVFCGDLFLPYQLVLKAVKAFPFGSIQRIGIELHFGCSDAANWQWPDKFERIHVWLFQRWFVHFLLVLFIEIEWIGIE